MSEPMTPERLSEIEQLVNVNLLQFAPNERLHINALREVLFEIERLSTWRSIVDEQPEPGTVIIHTSTDWEFEYSEFIKETVTPDLLKLWKLQGRTFKYFPLPPLPKDTATKEGDTNR